MLLHSYSLYCSCSYYVNFASWQGRTGLMVSAYLVYSGMSAEEALQVYAHKRTTNNEGVPYITTALMDLALHGRAQGSF
ncbi:Phosphatidylinositol 3,4,5-trisphosphate 3-phosphatase and protein-tyrosine-phosphatase PTEN1 [Camellia lanceoleosa]|uniref:Phosphatidylinositol 3,4,5-trisphosphate 3-phosphatase and protein-tyrosine-phosphatase PTEN1 n=1 Tax=Camellia lanceoleosa TaxID=1840588 RepID=A0ACC0GMW0_9ERIC|nr:Phosphatidylinositol 3,4,5-trisphosphate 3-phosphatase and protein-tyrosine-phosphatase PTEN1 [Camellia lanceoleosa]